MSHHPWLGGHDTPPSLKQDLSATTVGPAHRYIARDDNILGGGPIIVGTRVPDARGLADRYRVDSSRIRVVSIRGKPANEHVAATGAEVLRELIKEVGMRKNPVHLGLGSGWTTLLVAGRLVQPMRRGYDGPGLVLHALSSGFDANDPLRSPVAFFGPFQELPVNVSYVGLLDPEKSSEGRPPRAHTAPSPAARRQGAAAGSRRAPGPP